MATAKKAPAKKAAPAAKKAAPAARPAAKKAAPKAEARPASRVEAWESGERYLGQGAVGADVEAVQRHVDEDLVVDGVYGPKTEKSVKRWQKSRGRLMTGEIRKADWRDILAADEVVSDDAE